ncbi:sensor histidine kinase [Maribellus sediminis]|uniref:sensor histidine kinase n=1 Tax=Maribellus sediminis TaxID=2696285 RepID=UPI0014317871|nr:histidine kinase [Maribellus sediminis]
MKTQHILFILCTLLSLGSLAQEQTILLKLEEGHEYVFEITDQDYGILKDNSKDIFSVQEKVFRLFVEKFVANQEAIVSVSFLENTLEQPLKSNKINKKDFFYPDFSAVGNVYGSTDLFSMYLCRSDIKFLINLNTRNAEMLNRVELLEGFFQFLKLQGIDGKEREAIAKNVNSKLLNKQKYLIEHLLWFHNSAINADSTLNKSLLEDRLKINRKGNQFLAFSDMDFDNLIPAKTYKKYWVNTENGIVSEYTTIRRDSMRQSFYGADKLKWQVNETHFRLLYSKPVAEKKLVISGSIESPLSNIIHLKTLSSAFGTEMKDRIFMLDEKGYFETEIDFSEGGFVYVENENKNKHEGSKMFVFYAEPGDTIGFVAKGAEQPWYLSFSGTRVAESELLEKISNQINFKQDLRFIFNYLYGDLTGKDKVLAFYDSLETMESLISSYKTTIDERTLRFIINETKSYVYTGFYNFFTNARRSEVRLTMQGQNGKLIAISNDATIEDSELNELENHIDKFNIQDIYNDYGLFSRKMVESYCAYQFFKIRKVTADGRSGFGVDYTRDLDSRIQFMRLMLSGSALYREIASVLESVLIAERRMNLRNDVEDYWINYAIENTELLSKRCNDLNLVSSMTSIVRQHQKLQSDSFLPQISFLDLDGNKVTLNDLSEDKPTVVCISEGFGHNRYLFDEFAQKNQDINFVLVCENNSYDWWKEYTSRAEPVAKQLLFVNDSNSIRDIFQKRFVYVVLDKKGEMTGYADETEAAIKKARATLEPQKKQLDKSQLQFIVLLLVITLVLLLLVLFIWKWRVRQRFRKEQQRTRLRELELTAIRSQMNPHFLFNSLNSVQNLVQQNKGREAHLYLSDFAGLIRKVLNNSEKEEVSLAEELEMIQQYLSLEKLRFDFDYSLLVDEQVDVHNTMVPSMILQPFVENAIIHGLQNKASDRQLKIEVEQNGTELKISIEDNGIGREAAQEISKSKNGKGSKLVQERLKILQEKNKEKFLLEIIDQPKGTRVVITLPEES